MRQAETQAKPGFSALAVLLLAACATTPRAEQVASSPTAPTAATVPEAWKARLSWFPPGTLLLLCAPWTPDVPGMIIDAECQHDLGPVITACLGTGGPGSEDGGAVHVWYRRTTPGPLRACMAEHQPQCQLEGDAITCPQGYQLVVPNDGSGVAFLKGRFRSDIGPGLAGSLADDPRLPAALGELDLDQGFLIALEDVTSEPLGVPSEWLRVQFAEGSSSSDLRGVAWLQFASDSAAATALDKLGGGELSGPLAAKLSHLKLKPRRAGSMLIVEFAP